MRYLVMYDISDDRKRARVERLLAEWGMRVNYSVFEIESSKAGYRKVIKRLLDLTDRHDDVRIYHLTPGSLTYRLHHQSHEKELYF